MSDDLEIVLRWRLLPQVGDRDMRTFDVLFEFLAGADPVHLYKVSVKGKRRRTLLNALPTTSFVRCQALERR